MLFRSADLRRIVNNFGREATLRTKAVGSYDPSTGDISGTTNTDYTIKTYLYEYRLDEIDGRSIVAGDRRAVIHSLDTGGSTIPEPEVDDEIRGLGDTVSIVSVSKIYSGDTLVCYIAQVRE